MAATQPISSSRRRGASVLGAYCGTFPRRARLERDEEVALVRRAAAGDTTAAEELIAAHFPLLVKTTLAFRQRSVPVEDLLGEACIGLLEAVDRFDPDRGFRFMTYAVWWVRRALVRALALQSRTVRIPRHRVGADGAALPTEIPLETDGPEGSILDGLTADDPAADDVVLGHENTAALRAALGSLPDRQRHVLLRRFGLDGRDGVTLKTVAGELGVTKERVRQIEAQALGHLEQRLRGRVAP